MKISDIANIIHEKTGISKTQSAEIVSTVFDAIKEGLASGEKVNIAGFGNFDITTTAARTGRNPRTGEEIAIPAGKRPSFKSAKGLKDAVSA